jgi:RelE-like toxin of type II toxin-antitoxin system HigB
VALRAGSILRRGSTTSGLAGYPRSSLTSYNATRYSQVVIQGFSDREAQRLWEKRSAPKFGATQKAALRKLSMVDAAHTIQDLRSPPANRLERLSGDR